MTVVIYIHCLLKKKEPTYKPTCFAINFLYVEVGKFRELGKKIKSLL